MMIKDVMTKRVATCRLESNLAEAVALMWDYNCGVLPVLGDNGEIAGIVTDRDICVALGTRNVRASDLYVGDVIKRNTLVCKPSDDIRTALQTMRDGKIRRLPVVSDETVIEGIVSMDDLILKAIQRDGAIESGISFGDLITTLQAIYAGNNQLRGMSAAV